MLTLSRKCDYGLIALSHLARFPKEVASAREIASRYRIPLPLLMNILKQLNREGMVTSTRGARGGYRLARDPNEVSVRDVVAILEGPVRLVRCAGEGRDGNGTQPCERVDMCPVRGSALKLHRRLEQFLGQVTLAEIIESPLKVRMPQEGDESASADQGAMHAASVPR